MGTRGGAVLVCAIVAPTLSGCSAADTPESAVTSSPSSAAPSTSPTKQVTTKPEISDLELTADGLGYIRIGQPVPSTPAETAIVAYDPTACVGGVPDGVKAGQPGAGAWMSTYPGSYFDNFDIVTAGSTESGIVTSIDAFTSSISTDRGIHTGSSLAELLAAYSSFGQNVDAGISEVYVVEGKRGQLLMEVAKNDPTNPGYWQNGETGRVLWIRTIPLGVAPYAIAGTDSSGPCPV